MSCYNYHLSGILWECILEMKENDARAKLGKNFLKYQEYVVKYVKIELFRKMVRFELVFKKIIRGGGGKLENSLSWVWLNSNVSHVSTRAFQF